MKPYYEHEGITIYHGDCREILPDLSAEAVVTDPPYGGATGSAWNATHLLRSRRTEMNPMTTNENIEKIAKLTHEINRAYCLGLGDDSQPPWGEAPEWQKSSAMNGVRAVLDGSASNPEQQHENWMAQKVSEGWVYGPVKDPAKKQHPCMVPYNQLPRSQQTKDMLFRAAVLTGKEIL